MACGLTYIRRETASTLKTVHHTRSQVLGNFILKRGKRRDSSGGKENEPDVKTRESGAKKAIDLGADFKRMCPCVVFLGTVSTKGLGSKVLSENLRCVQTYEKGDH